MWIESYNIDKKITELTETPCVSCERHLDGYCQTKEIGVSSLYHCNSPMSNGSKIEIRKVPGKTFYEINGKRKIIVEIPR